MSRQHLRQPSGVGSTVVPFWHWGKQGAALPAPRFGRLITHKGVTFKLRGEARKLDLKAVTRAMKNAQDTEFMEKYVNPRCCRV